MYDLATFLLEKHTQKCLEKSWLDLSPFHFGGEKLRFVIDINLGFIVKALNQHTYPRFLIWR